MNAIVDRPDSAPDEIRYSSGACSLGIALVATSNRGIVAILLGDDQAALHRDLIDAFPYARITPEAKGLGKMIAQVTAFLDAPQQGLDLPLDMRGSAMQRAVWQALREIPIGQTVTYGQIARTLPLSATAQEVGVACASNLLAVAVPCHRVVKADGSISGYRWGVQRKRRLINREAEA